MIRTGWKVLLAGVLALVLAWGCRQQERAPDQTPGVTATAAYRTHFGPPPTVESGECFALVGFLPTPGEPARIRPFPLFMFGEERRMEALVEQLLQWSAGPGSEGGWVNPFPPGSELVGITREQADLVRVELSGRAWQGSGIAARQGMVLALGHALGQFPGVRRVMVVAGGHLLPGQAERGFVPDPETVIGPGPPRLLSLVGIWEPGAEDLTEISAYFDRPLEVSEFRLLQGDREVAGDYYRSVFDMAVVVHPSEPGRFREGTPLRVVWQVEDRLGRSSSGDAVHPLGRLEHR